MCRGGGKGQRGGAEVWDVGGGGVGGWGVGGRGEESGIALGHWAVLADDELEVTRFRPVHERLKSCLDEGLRGVSGGDEGDDPGRGLGRAEAVIGIDRAAREAFVLAVFPEPGGEVFEGAGDHPVIMDCPLYTMYPADE